MYSFPVVGRERAAYLGFCRTDMMASMPRTPADACEFFVLFHHREGWRTQAALGVADVHRVLLDAKLAAEVALGGEVEGRADAVVRLLERLDPESVHVLRRVQLVDRARPERRRLYTRIAELLNDEGEDVLDRTEWRTRELERPFDLEAVPGCELGKDDHGIGLDGDMVQSLFR